MVARLSRQSSVRAVRSIRHAAILLVAGSLRESDTDALKRLHDQLPHPRTTLWWGCKPFDCATAPTSVAAHDNPAPILDALDRNLLTGARRSEEAWLADAPPNPWRGKGEHGQGGKGMMGGTPYGRKMAMIGADLRDGLELDSMTVTLGPFFPLLPPGLALEMTLQGDVIQEARVCSPAWPDSNASTEPLLRAARMLELLELGALALRCRRAAAEGGAERASLLQAARRAGAFLAIPPRLGRVRDQLAEALGGGEAVGPEDDTRLVDRLPGLEWQEAMLLINCFDPQTLRRIARPEPSEERQDGADEKGEIEAT
ncbi:hypothetical protein [Altererythrobacter sp. B11]|uniref:hypothetical protein n=1 Tax=Altererythrobacter sp. B11 TaxID=2060312 RepID=UPI0011AE7C0F|nr:hypothetical protein [Altererythrobacter sp. B11]